MDKSIMPKWGGIEIADGTIAEIDYDRACLATKYTEVINMRDDFALIIGDAPLDTMFYEDDYGPLFVVKVWYCDPQFDFDCMIRSLPKNVFDNPVEKIQFEFGSSELVLFDSSYPGREANNEAVTFFIAPGRYHVLTIEYEPDASTSLILHRFDRQ